MATTSLVTQITGQAWVRGADGSLTPLHQGMRVPADADIVTATGASVQLQADGVPALTIGENRDVQLGAELVQADVDPSTAAVAPPADADVAQVLAALNSGADPLAELDPTAAVLQGGAGGDGGSSFTRLVGVVETTSPLGLEYPRPGAPTTEEVRLAGTGGGDDEDAVQLPPPSLEIADGNGIAAGQLTLAENASQSAPGSFTLSAPAGLLFVSIGDTTLTSAQLSNTGNAPVTIQTANGQITLIGFDAATGTVTYEYTVGGAQDHSAGDDSVVDTIAVVITDGSGRQVTDTIGVQITDTNPVAVGENGGELVEDNSLVSEISGNVLDNDSVFDGPGSVSWNNPANAEVLSRLEQFGTITLGADGQWTFTLDSTKPAVQALAQGQEVDFQISYTVADSDGDTVDATLTFKVVGTNDAPMVISGPQAATVTELADLVVGENETEHAASGAVTFADVDLTDTHTATVAAQGDDYVGTLTLGGVDQAGNSVGWDFKVDDSVLDSLAAGQKLEQKYNVTIADGKGGTVTQTVTITIMGTNDAPTITSDAQAATITEIADKAAGENTALHEAGGAVTFADVDLTDTHTATVSAQGDDYLGTLTLGGVDQAGNSVGWNFQVADSVLDSLAAGQKLEQKYDVTITDGNGGTVTETVTITITGTNDAPTVIATSSDMAGAVTERADGVANENTGNLSDTGHITFADVDLTDTHTAVVNAGVKNAAGETVTSPLGTLTLNEVNNTTNTVGWTYTVPAGQVDYLAVGQTLTQVYSVTISDGNGGTVTRDITVTLTGTNDAPTVIATGSDMDGAVTERADGAANENTGNLSDTGHITFADVDLTDTHTAVVNAGVKNAAGETVASPLGTLTLGALNDTTNTVGWTYTVPAGQVDYLAAGQTLTQVYSVTISDGNGGTVTRDITVTITGTNDAPTIIATGSDMDGTVTERGDGTADENTGNLSDTGHIAFADVDLTDTHSASVNTIVKDANGEIVTSPLGTLTLGELNDTTNTVGWTYTVPAGQVDYLAAGQTLTQVYSVTISDGNGGTVTRDVTVTIVGTNDAPVIDFAGGGTVSVSEEGLDRYWLRPDGLPDGAPDSDTTNSTKATGSFQVSDVDQGSALAVKLGIPADALTSDGKTVRWTLSQDGKTLTGRVGLSFFAEDVIQVKLHDEGNGSYRYDVKLLGPVDHSDPTTEDVLGLTIPVTVSDGTAIINGNITVRIEDDSPNATDDFGGKVYEDARGGSAVLAGNVLLNDGLFIGNPGADNSGPFDGGKFAWDGAANAATLAKLAQYGTLSLSPNGSWLFTLNNQSEHTQALAKDQLESFKLDYTVTDNDGDSARASLTIQIQGTNDAPTLSATNSAVTFTETDGSQNLSASGALTFADVDTDDVVSISSSYNGDINWNGGTLTAGQIAALTGGAAAFNATGANGTGSWDYAANGVNLDFLAAGETVTFSYTVTATDSHNAKASKTVTVTITGTNDKPEINGVATGSVQEDGTSSATEGQLTVADVDATDTHTWSLVGSDTGTYGSIELDATGKWVYTLDNDSAAVQGLKTGDTKTESFTVKVDDGNGGTDTQVIEITITGKDDGAVITPQEPGDDAGAVKEEVTLTAGGKLDVVDPDAGQAVFVAQTATAGAYGTFTIGTDGTWTYTLNNDHAAVQALGEGKTLPVETFTVTTADGTTSSVTVTITGTNDKPAISGPATGSVQEDGTSLTTEGQLTVADVDTTDTHTWSLVGSDTGTYGSIELDATGKWVYTLDNDSAAVQALKTGDTKTESFTVKVDDGNGGTDTQVIEVTITGKDDGAVITPQEPGDDAGAVKEEVTLTAGGKLDVVDPDAGQAVFVAQAGTAGAYGTFKIGTDGTWTYTLNNDHAAVQALGEGKTLPVETFTVTTADGTTSSVTVTITGTNDKPAISGPATGSVQEDGTSLTTEGQLTVADVDTTDTHTWSLVGSDTGTYGSIELDATGKWVYTLDNDSAAVQALKTGDTKTESFTVKVDDGNGGTDTQVIEVTITGKNDAPTLNPEVTLGNQTGEDAQKITPVDVSGQFQDVDAGDTLTFSATGLPAGLSISAAGVITGKLDKSASQGGAEGVYTIVVTATDSAGTTVTQTFEWDVSNPAPKALADAGATDEDTSLTVDAANGVLKNDTDKDGDALTVSEVNGQAASVGTVVAGSNGGTFTLRADGSYVFNPGSDFNYLGKDQKATTSITYTVSDGEGGTSTATLTVTVDGISNAASIGSAELVLSEEALTGGIPGSNGTDDAADRTGTLSISNGDGQPLTISLSLDGLPALSSGGEPITWSYGSNQATVLGKTASGDTVIEISVNDGNTAVSGSATSVDYNVKLLGPVDHPNTGAEDVLNFDATVQISDGVNEPVTGTIGVTIEDDAPVANPYSDQAEISTVNTNILLMIDVSGSMGGEKNWNGSLKYPSGVFENGVELTRLEVAKRAIAAMLDKYDDLGDAKVRVVTFSSDGSQKGGKWLSVDEAMDYINNLSASGGTNYDEALDSATSAWNSSGKIAGANNVSYFFSDGDPSSNSDGINSSEQADWESFLKANDINSYAVGMGPSVNENNLKPIAYDGVKETNSDAANVIIVNNFNDLADRISGTVGSPTVQGDLISDSLAAGANGGADGGYVKSITIDGVTYSYNQGAGTVSVSGGTSAGTYNPATHTLTVTTDLGAKFVINLDTGAFTHTGATQTGTDQFSYTVADGDGDSASSTLTIKINGPVAPDAVNDHVITNILSSQIVIDSAVLLANDQQGTNPQPLGDVTVNTGWLGGDFTRSSVQTIDFDSENNRDSSKNLLVARSDFSKAGQAADRATVVVDGYLDQSTKTNGTNIDIITVALLAGEKLTLDHNLEGGWVKMEYKGPTGGWNSIDDGSFFEAGQTGNYEIRVTNIQDPGYDHWFWGWQPGSTGEEDYLLTMTVDYSGAQVVNVPDAEDSYTIVGSAGSDSADITVSYQAGNTLHGTNGHETLLAGSGNDTLNGGKGNDVLIGGKGNDTLVGGDGDDVFRWELNDQGSTSQPAKDVITDFGNGNDKLDLSDLLVGEGAAGADLSKYLQLTEVNGDTVININTKGQLGATDGNGAATNFDQQITLKDVDLDALTGGGSQNDMITHLIQQGKLNVDQ